MKLEDGSVMRIYPQVAADFGLYPGLVLDDAQWKALQEAAGAFSAKMRAVRIVSASSVSRRALERRLRQKGETEDDAQNAVRWMDGMGLLDDMEVARQVVRRGESRGYGKARIRQMLYEKQVPKELWEEALSELSDPDEAIFAYLERNLPQGADPRQRKKVIDALLRRGHSWQDVRRCLRNFGQDPEDFSEEYNG